MTTDLADVPVELRPAVEAALSAAGVEDGHLSVELVGAERTLVQKSGYFARSAAANAEDRRLIAAMAEVAVKSALQGVPGLIGHDEERGDVLRAIELPRIKGGKAFDAATPWFTDLLESIGQG